MVSTSAPTVLLHGTHGEFIHVKHNEDLLDHTTVKDDTTLLAKTPSSSPVAETSALQICGEFRHVMC